MTSSVCIVDAYSTGADLPWRFYEAGYNVVHIANDINAPELTSSLDNRNIQQTFSLATLTSMEELVSKIAKVNPRFIVPGTETGIELADQLANFFSLRGNTPSTSAKRRNKTLMQIALKEKGLDHIRGFRAESSSIDLEELISEIGFPCVVKPEMSAGADDVYFCDDINNVKMAIDSIVGKTNQIGGLNEAALVQELLTGVQYFINAISVDGRHFISEIWKDLRLRTPEGRVVCDREILLAGTGPLQDTIRHYVGNVLSALDIENGASHTELIVTKRGPVLIETAARMQGTILPAAVEKALGYSHPSLLKTSMLNPTKFVSEFPQPYQRNKSLNVITLISKDEGRIVKNNLNDLLKQLPSYAGVIHTPVEGDFLHKTVDLFTNPGTIYLCSDNPEQLEYDYEKIRGWESEGAFFELEK